MIFICKDLESIKIDLALKHDFNLHDAFFLFDTQDLGCITIDDLADGLRHNLQFGEFCDEDMYLLMKLIDTKGLQRITFKQFNDTVLPFSQEYANRVCDRPPFFKKHGTEYRHFFHRETRDALRALWRGLIQSERQLE